MSFLKSIAVALGLMAAPVAPAHKPPAPPPSDYVVRQASTPDEKAVFATIETANVVPARARVGGTIAELKVSQGDQVEQGQVIALVGDPKRAMQLHASAAQVQAAQAQLAQARADYDRAQRLKKADAISQSAFDQARTAYNVAASQSAIDVGPAFGLRATAQGGRSAGADLRPRADRAGDGRNAC